jgi:anti-sigma regulatory factor (Ser/Thr protein kinase)
VALVLDALEAAMTEIGYSQRERLELRLVMEEGIVNGLRHGNGCDPAKRVRVQYLVDPEAVVAEIEDEGPGFNPEGVLDPNAPENLDKPSGCGVFLMRQYTDWLCYLGRGNHLALCRYRSGRAPKAPQSSV